MLSLSQNYKKSYNFILFKIPYKLKNTNKKIWGTIKLPLTNPEWLCGQMFLRCHFCTQQYVGFFSTIDISFLN